MTTQADHRVHSNHSLPRGKARGLRKKRPTTPEAPKSERDDFARLLRRTPLGLIPTVKRLERLEPVVGDFAARQYAGNGMISRYVSATSCMELTVRCRRLPVPRILPKASPVGREAIPSADRFANFVISGSSGPLAAEITINTSTILIGG